MRYLGFILLFLVLNGCKPQSSDSASLPAGAQTYEARGVVQKVAPDKRSVTIAHEAIPGYMMAMTMDFPVRDTNELAALAPGDGVTFDLVVSGTTDWINHVRVTGMKGTVQKIPAWSGAAELKPGDVMPDFGFVTEGGTLRHLTEFRGQPLAFTFFFTSCPLPDFCPRMSRNFSEARQLVLAATNAPARWQFLSLSFDPSFDTPEILSNYARLYRGEDTRHWLFAAIGTNTLAAIAPRLDLMVLRSVAGITHNLRTVVLDGDGRIVRQFDGNNWTPHDLADSLIAAGAGH